MTKYNGKSDLPRNSYVAISGVIDTDAVSCWSYEVPSILRKGILSDKGLPGSDVEDSLESPCVTARQSNVGMDFIVSLRQYEDTIRPLKTSNTYPWTS